MPLALLGRERPEDADGVSAFDGEPAACDESGDWPPESESSATAIPGLLAIAKPSPRANAAEPTRAPNEPESMTPPTSSDIPTSLSINHPEMPLLPIRQFAPPPRCGFDPGEGPCETTEVGLINSSERTTWAVPPIPPTSWLTTGNVTPSGLTGINVTQDSFWCCRLQHHTPSKCLCERRQAVCRHRPTAEDSGSFQPSAMAPKKFSISFVRKNRSDGFAGLGPNFCRDRPS
jgi:hypothetical protein